MKKLYYVLIFIFTFSAVSAQEKLSKEEKERRQKNIQAANPFAKYGYKAKVATLSNGKYLEVHDLDSIVTIGTIRWHVAKQQIVGTIKMDTLNIDLQPIGDAPGRWISMDPLSEEFSSWSPYSFVMNSPLRFNDPTGMAPEDIITPTFQNDTAKQQYISTVNSAMGGMYEITVNTAGNIQMTPTGIQGPLTPEQQAFHDEYKVAIDSPLTINQHIMEKSVDTNVGSFVTGKIDMADVVAFDAAGPGGATSAGAIIHETKEQLVKAEMGLPSQALGTMSEFQVAHAQATQAENRVNGNVRTSNTTYTEKNGSTTTQTITPNTITGRNTVTKVNMP